MITQEYFDEVYEENVETFDLSPVDALKETIEQLQHQQQTPSSLRTLHHISTTTSPDSDVGRRVRKQRQDLVTALQGLKDSSGNNNAESSNSLRDLLLNECLTSEDALMFRHWLVVNQGIATLLSQPQTFLPVIAHNILELSIPPQPLEDWRRLALQQSLSAQHMEQLLDLMAVPQPSDDEDTTRQSTGLLAFLRLGYWSCRHNEANKKQWMKIKEGALARLLVDTLNKSCPNEVAVAVARWITVLCTFDEHKGSSSGSAGMVVQASHQNVKVLAEEGAVAALQSCITPDTGMAVYSALRALAIQDDIVQSMIAMGVVEQAVKDWRSPLENQNDGKGGSSLSLQTALLGLFRNLCANDTLKTSLCRGNLSIVVPDAFGSTHHSVTASPLLAEHLCGTVAAMALRQPENAQHLVQAEWHVQVVQSMQAFASKASVQRQGALALRNLVSRDKSLVPALVHAKDVLFRAAATHVQCQDEVYAALRDLGLVQPGSMQTMELVEDDGGQVVGVTKSTSALTFGERNPNFRPVFD